MKKIFLLLFLMCGVLLSSAEEKKEIPIKKDPEPTPEFRMPYYSYDITAYYQDGVVYLQFGYDMGNVDVTVTNETTGEMWQQTDDSAFGSVSIATSAAAGSYTISIVTDDGVCYSGSFAL